MKKMMRIAMAAMLASAMLLTSCTTNNVTQNPGGDAPTKAAEGAAPEASKSEGTPATEAPATPALVEGNFKVYIAQIVEHPALDAAKDGFKKALDDNGFKDGENLQLEEKNASGEQSNLKTISEQFVSANPDLILGIATPTAISLAVETQGKDIPVLFTAVTDPVESKIVESNEKPGKNVTGTSDRAPIKEQVELMRKILPDAKKIAVMYNSSEVNSQIQADEFKAIAETQGFTVEYKTITSTNDIDQVAQSIVGTVDAIYLPTDNTIASAIQTLSRVTTENKIPVFCAEENMARNGGLATVSISYYNLGYKTGEMAVRILKGESKPADMAIEYDTNPTILLNQKLFEQFGIAIPADLKDVATMY